MKKSKIVFCTIMLGGSFFAVKATPGSDAQRGTIDITGQMFLGTAVETIQGGSGTQNGAFTMDLDSGASVPLLPNEPVWAATADPENRRILFIQSMPGSQTGGNALMALAYDSDQPVFLGELTGAQFFTRLNGLAMRNGELFGTESWNSTDLPNSFYRVDMDTLTVQRYSGHLGNVNALETDPDTCVIYGADDLRNEIVKFDESDSRFSAIAPYPAGFSNIDSMAIKNGHAYLISAEMTMTMPVLNLSTLSYEAPIATPLANLDNLAGSAIAHAPLPADLIHDSGFEFTTCHLPMMSF